MNTLQDHTSSSSLRLPSWLFQNRFSRSFPSHRKLMPIMGFLITPQGLEKGLVFLDLGESLLPTEGLGPRASYNLTFPNSSSIPLGDWPDLRITELILSGLHLSLPTNAIPNLKFKAHLYWVPIPPPRSGLSHHLHSSCSAYSWDWTFLGFPCSHWFLFPDVM